MESPADVPTTRDAAPAAWSDVAQPERIGRYQILGELGRGGMGVVYRARDPALERAVAIKLVRAGPRAHAEARERLSREARVLARLSHPNVVEVFEIGAHEGQLFIAMEMIEGESLRQWCRRAARTPDEILAVMTEAARGLAAAHAAGLVHRDFKPDNIIVGRDGRVRVLDFGLAVAPQSELRDTSTDDLPSEPVALDDGDERLTATGVAMGTPAYMAPEQFRALSNEPAIDQFAFFVTLFEALAGERPFPGKTFAELAKSTTTEGIDEALAAKIPRRLMAPIRRGLSRSAGDRYSSMHEAIAAIAPRRRPRWWPWAGVGIVALGGGGLALAIADRPRACPSVDEAAASLFPAEARARVESAIEGTEADYAPAVWTEVRMRMDRYAQDWAGLRAQTCEAARREDAPPAVDATLRCLEERRVAATAVVDVLATIDATALHKAPRILGGLEDPTACADAATREAEAAAAVPPALQGRLATIRASLELGRYRSGLTQLESARELLPRAPGPGLTAALGLLHGRLLAAAGRSREAADALERAYFAAAEAERSDLASQAASAVAGDATLAYQRRWRWARHSQAALERHGDAPSLLATHEAAMCALQRDSGDLDDATRRCEIVLALADESEEPERITRALRSLGRVVAAANDHDRAHALARRAVDLAETTWGTDHPLVADAHNDLGEAALGRDDLDEARREAERALEIRRRTLGGAHPDLALSLDLLAAVAQTRRDFGEAESHAARGLALRTKAFGEAHPLVARSLYARALAEEELGKHAEALRTIARVSEIDEQLHPLNIDRLPTLREQARMAFEIGDGPSQGRLHLEKAWSIVERSAIPADHPMVRDLNHGYGETLLALGEAETALPYLEAFVADPRPHDVLPHLKFVLARAIVATGGDRARARRLIDEAREAWREPAIPFHHEQLDEMQAYLAEQDL